MMWHVNVANFVSNLIVDCCSIVNLIGNMLALAGIEMFSLVALWYCYVSLFYFFMHKRLLFALHDSFADAVGGAFYIVTIGNVMNGLATNCIVTNYNLCSLARDMYTYS